MSRASVSAAICSGLLVALAACGRKPAAIEEPRPQYSAVVAAALAKVEAQVAAERGSAILPSAQAMPAQELEEQLSGLVEFASTAEIRERELAIADLVGTPPEATAWLVAHAIDPLTPAAQSLLCTEVLARRGGSSDAFGLIEIAEKSRNAAVRAKAYERLGQLPHDEVMPRLVLRLRYEVDWEAVLNLGSALCTHGLYSGLDGLLAVADRAPDEALRVQAANEGRKLAEAAGVADARELAALWLKADDRQLAPRPRSAAYRLELWRWIARFDEFQLRGVDDARFIMARLDPVAAEVLAEALPDESSYVRLGVAQCLERMGPRARAAGPALLANLADPELAPWMASAAAHVGYAPAREALEARLGPERDAALRVACARGLGHMGMSASLAALRTAFAGLGGEDPPELAQALAESLVLCGDPEPPLDTLITALTDARLEPSSSTAALRKYLEREAAADVPGSSEALARWDEIATEHSGVAAAPDASTQRTIESARAEGLRAWLDARRSR